jgi:hypothetical protein
MEGARIYAQNAIREKNSSLNFLRLGSRVDAVAARLESAIRMQVCDFVWQSISVTFRHCRILYFKMKFCVVHDFNP